MGYASRDQEEKSDLSSNFLSVPSFFFLNSVFEVMNLSLKLSPLLSTVQHMLTCNQRGFYFILG